MGREKGFEPSPISADVEQNFEQNREYADFFKGYAPRQTLALLDAAIRKPITPGRTLLFLDEVQAVPEVFASLRFFQEQLPELHIVCAGSLLEFVLADHTFSMPVGRIEYLHLGALTFEEFLLAYGKDSRLQLLQTAASYMRIINRVRPPRAVSIFAPGESFTNL